MTEPTSNGVKYIERSDIWRTDNSCLVCQSVCSSSEDKRKHEELPKHVKKLKIYDFFAKEAANLPSSDKPSSLMKRYQRTREKAVGLECIHELQFPWSTSSWWACSICYDSGCVYEQADQHLMSLNHLQTYIEEFHPYKASTLPRNDKLKLLEELIQLREDLYAEQGEKLLPPEILVMSLSKEEAIQKLGIDDSNLGFVCHKNPSDVKRRIIQCWTCHELIPCKKNYVRTWSVHERSLNHRNCAIIKGALEQIDLVDVVDGEVSSYEGPYYWKNVKDVHYGPVCGVKYLVVCERQNLCQLCFCNVESIEEHFSSENHIARFLSVAFPLEMYSVLQLSCDARRRGMLDKLSKTTLENEQTKKAKIERLPGLISERLNPDVHVFPPFMPELTPLGIDASCLFCMVCWLSIKVDKDVQDRGVAIWDDHCSQQSHFDYAVRRATFSFDDDFFVMMASTIPKAERNLHGKWKDVEVDGGTTYRIQTQCDVGLEYVVEDQENDEVVCTLCARTYKRENHDIINNHIRSYIHLNQYLHVTNRNLLSLLLVQKSEQAVQDLMLEWLQRASPNVLDEMRVYSPEKALTMDQWEKVPYRKVESANYNSIHRPVYESLVTIIDAVSQDDAEKSSISLREALSMSGVKIQHIQEVNGKTTKILCRCTGCELLFTTTVANMVEDVWEKHLLSDEHFRRMTAFMASKLDMFGFSESCSAYTVKPFVQKDPNKKITWQWNSKNKVHDFVLSIIGLEDLVERRSNEVVGEHAPDFFCRLCATVIPRRAMLLEAHVRSVQHVLCYLHKYHPLTILKIDGLPKEGGREIRRAIAQRLKDVRPKSEYCIPVYDPIGEQERKGIVAMQKAKEEERQRQMAEARKKAQEERKRKDEERRKLREQEIERERNRKIERERKEKEARDRAKRIEDERQRLRQVALENAQKVEDEKRAQVTEEKGRRQSQQAQLRSILDREKARLKVLQDRDKAQRLVQEKLDLEQKMKELQEKAALQKPVVVVPDPQLIIPAKLVNKPSQMPPITMISVPPPNMSVIPSTFNQYGVPPPVNSFTMSSPNVQYSEPPPELIRNTLELVGPKPVFSSFVPVAESMPIYPTRDAENSSDYDCSRSRSSSSSQTRSLSPSYHVYRPSLHGREVDPYITNPKIMHTRAQLVDFIWRQGAERIPPNELPLKFNKKASGMEGVLGLDCLYEVVCVDSPELDTFYCSMCGIWTTPSGMFIHLETKEHKLAYLFRNYKMYHQTVISETNNVVRTSMLSQFAIQIWRMEQPPSQVNNRLRSILDRATICRLWPEHVTVLDQSWRFEGNSVGRVDVPAPVSKEATQFNNPQKIVVKKSKSKDSDVEITDTDLPIVKKKKIDKKKTESFKQRKRSRSRDKRVDVMDINRRRKQMDLLSERKRRRSSSRDKHSRSRNWKHSHGRESRRRSRSRDSLRHNRSRSRENTVKDSNMSWEENAAAFLAKLGDFKAAAKVLDHKKNNHNNEKSQVTSPLDKQLGGGTPGINVDHQNSDLFAEKIKQIRNLAIPIQQKEIVQSMCAFDDISDICSGTQRQDSSYSRQPSCIQQSSQQQHFADEKVEMRKLLGVLITMQQEAERTGGLDAAIVDRLYREVGLQKKEGVANDQLLAQLCAQIAGQESPANKPAIDLESFGISKISNTEPTSQFHNQTPVSTNQYIPSTSHQLTSAILTKQRQVMNSSTNGSIFSLLSDVRSSLANIKSNRPPSPIVKPPPFVITKREDVFPESESFSFVYPDPDQEKERQEKVAFQSDSGSWKSPRNQFSFKNPHKNSFVFPQLIQASPGRNARSEYEPTYPAKPIRKLVQRGKLIVQEESNTSINNNQLTKKQKVALKKKELLEEAERLRKQAEEEGLDDGDDDWDNLETEMVQILDQPMVPKIGVPSTWTQPVPQKQKENPQTAKPEKIKENTPVLIASGQKMPLARTILPTRKLTSTLANNQQSPQLQEQWKNPTQQSSSSLDQKSALKRRLIGVPVSWPDSNTQAKELSVSTTQQKLSPLATVSSDYSQYAIYEQQQQQQQYFSASQQPVYPTHPAYVTQSFFPQQPPPGFSQQQYYGQYYGHYQ